MKLTEIAQSWILLRQQPPSLQDMAQARLDICDTCPSKKQLNTFGQILVKAFNEEGSTYLCGECGCPLAAKTINPTSSCPLKKWKAESQSYF